MPTPTVVWTAIPEGFIDNNTLKITVLATPRLILETGGEGKLSEFAAFLNWHETIRTLEFKVKLENIDVEPQEIDLESLDSRTWNSLFNTDTAVRSYEFDDYSGSSINTFSMKNTSESIKDIYTKCALGFSIKKPSIREYGFTNNESVITSEGNAVTFTLAKLGLRENTGLGINLVDGPKHGELTITSIDNYNINGFRCTYQPNKNFVGHDWFRYSLTNKFGISQIAVVNISILPSDLSHQNLNSNMWYGEHSNLQDNSSLHLDEIVSSPEEEKEMDLRLKKELAKNGFVASQDLPDLKVDIYRLISFHKALVNRDRPHENAEITNLDFHQVVSRLTQYPIISKKLGTVIDIYFRLPTTNTFEGKVKVDVCQPDDVADDNKINSISLWTSYYIDLDVNHLRFDAKPDSSGYIKERMLDVSNVDDFDVHINDNDSDSEKLYNFAQSLRSMALNADSQDEECGLPALRTSNFSLSHKKRAEILKKRIDRSSMIDYIVSNPQFVDSLSLTSTDLLKGFRIDVLDSFTNKWHSLCWRQGEYVLGNDDDFQNHSPNIVDRIPGTDKPDEGFLSLTSSVNEDFGGNKTLFLFESLASWDGWGLCIRQPGLTIGPDSTPMKPTNEYNTDFPLKVYFKSVKNSLPLLRFGGKYRFRLRAVDLAGNSLAPGSNIDSYYCFPPMRMQPSIYLRAEPISSPTLIRHRDIKIPGESIDTLVIRDYDWKNDDDGKDDMSQRHIIPPKVSQRMAELHGVFDEAFMKDGDPRRIYENIRDWNIPEIVEEDELEKLPYLPDPLAQGVSFYGLPGRKVIEPDNNVYQIPFSNSQDDPDDKCVEPIPDSQLNKWPNKKTFRLKLAGGENPPCWEEFQANTLTVYLPKADVVEIEASCYILEESLQKMALWTWMIEKDPQEAMKLKEHILRGRHWMFTPSRKIKLVHAVKKPLSSPEFQSVHSQKRLSEPSAKIEGRIIVHGKSTVRITITGKWRDVYNKVYDNGNEYNIEAVEERSFQKVIDLSTTDVLKSFSFLQHFGDPGYKRVTLTATALSRFRDYYDITEVEDKDMIVESKIPFSIDVLNSSRPPAMKIKYIIPTFRWDLINFPVTADSLQKISNSIDLDTNRTGKAVQTLKEERSGFSSYRSGNSIRVYIEPPWYPSGEGELMGVLLWSNSPPPHISANSFEMPEIITPYVTQWGEDPIWLTKSLPYQSTPKLEDLILSSDSKTQLSIPELGSHGNKKEVSVDCAGHKVHYDKSRDLWYCDIILDDGNTYFPFVRLALCRYQPKSLPDAHLSPVILADFVQLTPNRTANVVFDPVLANEINVGIVGPSPYISSSDTRSKNIIEITLEIKAKTKNTELWIPVNSCPEILESELDFDNLHVWRKKIKLPHSRNSRDFRLIVKEFVIFFTSPDGTGEEIRKLEYVEKLML